MTCVVICGWWPVYAPKQTPHPYQDQALFIMESWQHTFENVLVVLIGFKDWKHKDWKHRETQRTQREGTEGKG